MKIELFNRYTQQLEREQVYGEAAIEWLYRSFMGKVLNHLVTQAFVSKIYGLLQSTPWSRFKIEEFCQQYGIELADFLPEAGRSERSPYSNFNAFFIRRFRPDKRPFNMDAQVLPAFIEGRYLGFDHLAQQQVPVKGVLLDPYRLINHSRWATLFQGGPVLIGRLAPVDYHRFHFATAGKVLAQWRVPGILHSVNPLALEAYPEIFLHNERQISIVKTATFGHLAYIEVGAVCVGKIVQSYQRLQVERGEEKGYFLFGGSTVIVLGEPGRWRPCADICKYSQRGIETYVRLGDRAGELV